NLNVKTDVVTEAGISLEEAKKIALDHAGVKVEDVHFEDQELDRDDGVELYELEFYIDGYEYEYDIHAKTGEILKHERDQHKPHKKNSKKDKYSEKTHATNRKSTRLNSSHVSISYAVFCLKKKNRLQRREPDLPLFNLLLEILHTDPSLQLCFSAITTSLQLSRKKDRTWFAKRQSTTHTAP